MHYYLEVVRGYVIVEVLVLKMPWERRDKCIRERTLKIFPESKNRNFRFKTTMGGNRSEIFFKVAIPNVMANLEETTSSILMVGYTILHKSMISWSEKHFQCGLV